MNDVVKPDTPPRTLCNVSGHRSNDVPTFFMPGGVDVSRHLYLLFAAAMTTSFCAASPQRGLSLRTGTSLSSGEGSRCTRQVSTPAAARNQLNTLRLTLFQICRVFGFLGCFLVVVRVRMACVGSGFAPGFGCGVWVDVLVVLVLKGIVL